MHRRTRLIYCSACAVMLSCLTASSWARDKESKPLNYPQTRQVDHADEYHGVTVADPYRWLEELDSQDTRAWIDAQNKLTFAYLKRIAPRQAIKERLTTLWNYEKFGMPSKRGQRYFFTRNDGLQNQSVYYTMTSLKDPPRVLLDPNTLSPDGTVAVSGTSVSEDGRYMAYALSSGGSDWMEWKVRDVETGKDLNDLVKWSKFSGASWTHDHQGFFYSRYDEPQQGEELKGQNYYQKLYYHKLGTPQAEDVLVYEKPDQKEWGFSGRVTEDGKYLVISVWKGTAEKNLVFFKDLTTKGAPVVEMIKDFESAYNFIDNEGPIFWFHTDLNADRYRVIAVDSRNPAKYNHKEVIPQAQDTLRGVSMVNNMFVCNYLKDAHTNIKMFGLDGSKVREVALPGLGSAGGFGGKRRDVETFYSFSSYTHPTTIFRYDMKTGNSEIFRQPTVDFTPGGYETKQVFYRSKDGTRVPMFITHKKGITLNGENPTLLYGYGGFNVSLTPYFSVGNLVWLEMGGVYAVANLRGGGEYGKEWHESGMKLNKQNVFDDFISAAEWLVANRYTNSEKLAIRGGSNGGLLVGACINQRPDLFAAAQAAVGVMDMLRFNKFTIGWAWESDYGSPQNAQEFRALRAYSPLHNIKSGAAYPATLITTADHDDRVFPAHSFKYTAALQAAHQGPNPILIRVETRAGHGAGKPTTKRIEEYADVLAFLVQNLNMKLDW